MVLQPTARTGVTSMEDRMLTAVYPGTFDPLTRGHEDLVRRASRLFDTLVLSIADSRAKRTFFTLQERIEMAREVLADVKNVSVGGFAGLLTEFVRTQNARVVPRGRRPGRAAESSPAHHRCR